MALSAVVYLGLSHLLFYCSSVSGKSSLRIKWLRIKLSSSSIVPSNVPFNNMPLFSSNHLLSLAQGSVLQTIEPGHGSRTLGFSLKIIWGNRLKLHQISDRPKTAYFQKNSIFHPAFLLLNKRANVVSLWF